MKKAVTLKKMEVENFKGITSFSIDFYSQITEIVGENSTGKTSLLDAYMWTLVGCDSLGACNFKVMPIDEESNLVPKLITKVSLVLDIDGCEHKVVKEMHQSWGVNRTTKEDVFKGFSSKYFIDDVPYGEREYYSKIGDLICKKDDFLLLSSVTSFLDLDIKSRRAKLMEMAGEITIEDMEKEFPNVVSAFEKGKTIDEYGIQIGSSLKELVKMEKEIPLRISENEKDMPTTDFGRIREEIKGVEKRIEEIDNQLQKSSNSKMELFSRQEECLKKVDGLMNTQEEVVKSLRDELNTKNEGLLKEKSAKSMEIYDLEMEITTKKSQKEANEVKLSALKSRLVTLGNHWKEVNSKQFDEKVDRECPTCHKSFTEEEITRTMNELVKSFNTSKVETLKMICDEGDAVKAEYVEVEREIKSLDSEIAEKQSNLQFMKAKYKELLSNIDNLPTLDALKSSNKEYNKIQSEIDALRMEMYSQKGKECESDDVLQSEKGSLQVKLKSLITDLAEENLITKINERRKQLEDEARDISISISELQGISYEIMQYKNRYIDLVNEKVSSLFSYVKFQMYEMNISNDGSKEKCECLVGGVPYSTNLNAAAKINAGIDIINALSNSLNVSVPLWIDNKERVTKLIDTSTQFVTLSVVKDSALKRV